MSDDLKAIADNLDRVIQRDIDNRAHLQMRVPAEPDNDTDLVAMTASIALRSAADRITELEVDLAATQATIAAAPHDRRCWLITSKREVAKYCTCWKRDAEKAPSAAFDRALREAKAEALEDVAVTLFSNDGAEWFDEDIARELRARAKAIREGGA